MNLAEVDFFAAFIAALSSFTVGWIWYSPWLFRRVWMESSGLTELDLKSSKARWIFGGSFFLVQIIAIVLSLFITPDMSIGQSSFAGFIIGLCWVSTSCGVSYIFEQRPLKLFLVNSGFYILQYTLMGLIIGIWP
ncbi:DUF1761 domain-containing protein [Pseudoalteromonas sp. MMG010]|uniref:DUF1761 domain-containing protein n=1 Tax=Pseudoalteromonas sp. MMG010 TaxID=2822685 RepID=UPI001B39F3C4|nr:DUF1761 domain-containing protein [Pseudoalteromonas sp. MMG010]MBQ4833701.1 DUF1761 domain-containing protein [Pseudoalteromonas sp. MMG010]